MNEDTASGGPERLQLFGTDGVRGPVGEFLTKELVFDLACAAVKIKGVGSRVIVVRDTRESGEMLETAVAQGVAAAGGEALLAGVLPTPAVPLLIQRYDFDLGAVISASHNPFHDNWIKFFTGDGMKLSDEEEGRIERTLRESTGDETQESSSHGSQAPLNKAGQRETDEAGAATATSRRDFRSRAAQGGQVQQFHGALEDYLRALEERFGELDLSGYRVALDCANGSTFVAAPEIFRRLGAKVEAVGIKPDGRNINLECGSTHVERIKEVIAEGNYDVGFAFDGDGDRVLAVDCNGVVVDGDELIALAAIHLRNSGRLAGDGVAVTVMTNYGFHQAMKQAGIEVETTNLGDRYVLEALRSRNWALGGEQSGHVIDMNFVPSGDGIACALLTLESLEGGDLADRSVMQKLPQKLVNVKFAGVEAIESDHFKAAIANEAEQLKDRGRVLVRPSGTEPLLRIMAEAPTTEEAENVCNRLAEMVEGLGK